uniref:Uncharacterized protein n=1 Tax=Anopheles maculatus TaxID=74869 RepID=A0A182SW50_9DIPT
MALEHFAILPGLPVLLYGGGFSIGTEHFRAGAGTGIESESFSSNITRHWKPVDKCRNIHTNLVTETGAPNMIDMPAMDDHESTNMIDADLKAKMSRSGQQTPPTTNHRQVGRSSGSTLLESFLALTVAAVLGFALQ